MNQPDARNPSPDEHAMHNLSDTTVSPVTLRSGRVRWKVRSRELAAKIENLLHDPEALLASKESLIHVTPLVVMGRVTLPLPNKSQWLLRRANYGRPIARLRDFFRVSGSMRAFRNGIAFEKAGVPTPTVLAAGIVRVLQYPVAGYLLMEEINPVSKLAEYAEKHGHISNAVIKSVAAAIAHMHERGFVHGDLTTHNVLLDADRKPCFVDLERARNLGRPVDWRYSIEDFFRFAQHIVFFSPNMRHASLRLLKEYCQLRGWSGRERDLAVAILARLRRRVKW